MAVVGLGSLAVFALHGTDGSLSRDVGLYAYAGQQVADGVPPYVGVLNRAGPLAHAIPGLGAAAARLVGVDDLLGMRALFLLIAVLCICGAYVLARDLLGSRTSGLLAAAMLLSIPGFIHHASYGPRDKTAMVLFLTLTLWAMVWRRWVSAGFCLALAALVLQIALFVGVPTLAAAALLGSGNWRGRLLALGQVAIGGIVPLMATIGYFLTVGAFEEFLQAYALINARYTGANPMTDSWGEDWGLIVRGFGVPLVLVVAGILALPFLTWNAHRHRERLDDPRFASLAGLTTGAMAGVAWTVSDFDSWPDVFTLLPFAAVGTAGLAQAATSRLSARTTIAVVSVFLAATIGMAVNKSMDRDHRLDKQRASTKAMLHILPADARILSLEAPQPLVLSGRANPLRHQMYPPGLKDYIDDTWPGGFDIYKQDLLDERVELVALRSGWGPGWRLALKHDYVEVGCAPGWVWYARRDLGVDTLARLRRAGDRYCGVHTGS